MKLRAWPFPRTVSDWGTTIFLFFCMPCVYWFELWIVRPEFWPPDSFLYIFNFFLATFILFNVISNMMAVMMCNTSIVGEKIIRPAKSNSSLWKFCSVCETVVPPRAWHCQTCRVCILKRDHHCMFTGKSYRTKLLFGKSIFFLLISIVIVPFHRLLHRSP